MCVCMCVCVCVNFYITIKLVLLFLLFLTFSLIHFRLFSDVSMAVSFVPLGIQQ
jgi:hypothetical protein